ncbi:MAG: DUF1573 domain-containing protein [Patescibacteria group bacterium]
MNKYTIGILVLVILLGTALFFAPDGKKTEQKKEVASVIIAEPLSYDFGDIDIFGGKVTTSYALKNMGTEDVTILSGVTSCMCTEGEIDNLRFGMHESSGTTIVIPAGGEKILKATFDPLAHGPEGVGAIKRDVVLKTNSTETPQIKVVFAANVVKQASQ